MGGEWRKVRVEDIAEKIASGPFGSNLRGKEYTDGGVPVIRGNNLTGPRFNNRDYVYVSDQKADQLRASLAYPFDIVFAARGTVGAVGIVTKCRFSRFLLSSNLVKVTVDQAKADPHFVFYYFRSADGQNEILAHVNTTGVPKIERALESLRRFRINLPPLPEQRAIAHILGTLDDKIELNRRMNKTLEEMARAIFKSWFVDFDPVRAKAAVRREHPDWTNAQVSRAACPNLKPEIAELFPDRLVDSELGEIPEGWRVGTVQDLGVVICGKTPPTADKDNYGKDVPFVTIPDMHSKVFVTRTEKKLSIKGADTQKNKFLPPFSICVSCIATPGLVALTSTQCQTNQQINSVIPSNPRASLFCYFSLRGLGDRIRTHGAGGSVLLNLNKGQFSSLKLILPSDEEAESFQKVALPILKRILNNENECKTLAALRDALLPKLISGQIRVKDAEGFLKERGL